MSENKGTGLNYQELLRANKNLAQQVAGKPEYRVQVLSNITINQLAEPLEYVLRTGGLNAKVYVGDFNNIIPQAAQAKDYQATLIFWETCNIIEGLQFKSQAMDRAGADSIIEKVKSEIDLALANLQGASLVLWNRFSSLAFESNSLGKSNFDYIAGELNTYLEKRLPRGFFLIDLDKILSRVGVEHAIDPKFFLLFKSLYSYQFNLVYSHFVAPIFNAVTGRVKKVLVLDADNTLWNGIIGEDGMDGIKMVHSESKGAPYAEIQCIAKGLNTEGVLLCICSKNNFNDVKKVFDEHPDMLLKWEDFTIKKINWNDKVSNLREMAAELNLGLDSFVFVDDSDFEVNYVRENLPGITVFQVPVKQLYNYPAVFKEAARLFFNPNRTKEDTEKVQQYADELKRKESEKEFQSYEDYLASLKLECNLYINPGSQVPRISQMTQKTNQFNFTTRRYSEPDITGFLNSKDALTVTFDVKDRFGDYGITGLYILRNMGAGTWDIDTLLMSCRVIGRKVEYAIFENLANHIKALGGKTLTITYTRTPKNVLVENFADELGFEIVEQDETDKKYVLDLEKFKGYALNYVKVNSNYSGTSTSTP